MQQQKKLSMCGRKWELPKSEIDPQKLKVADRILMLCRLRRDRAQNCVDLAHWWWRMRLAKLKIAHCRRLLYDLSLPLRNLPDNELAKIDVAWNGKVGCRHRNSLRKETSPVASCDPSYLSG